MLERAEYERRSLARLARLIDSFRRRGLCTDSAYRRVSNLASFGGLDSLPVLTRAGAAELFERLKPLYAGNPRVFAKGTGGWSGETVHHYRDRRVDDYGYGMLIEMQQVAGWRPGMACYCLWGDPRELGVNYQPPRGLRRALSMVHLHGCYAPGERELKAFLDAVRADPGCAVYGFPNLLLQCVQYMEQRKIVLEPGVVATAWGTSEAMHPELPDRFRRAFRVRLGDYYGSREVASIAAKCEYGRFHVNARCIVEVTDAETGEAVPEGQAGHLLITDLFNGVTPMIRYQNGDLGAIAWGRCDCGRSGYFLSELIGRPPETITLKSGARFTPQFFSTLTMTFPAIHRIQLVRHALEEFELRYVGHQMPPAEQERIVQLMTSKTEGSACRLTRVDELEKAVSGKHRFFIDLTGATAGQPPA